jgi:2OG-Fe(II) oxygenase superfamily
MSSILPIDIENGFILTNEQAVSVGDKYAETYASASPFPHIMFDNFLPEQLLGKIIANFPSEQISSEVNFQMGYAGQYKRQIPPLHCNEFNRNLFAFFNSEPILKFLESLTGIKKLIPDPYFLGGGYHETSKGGLLGIHADFRVNKDLNLNRRINMIIYLNENWEESWGGHLELWDKSMTNKEKNILPIVNRCVIFNTDQDSFHGHPDPLNTPDGIKRRSIALYYYTASEKIYDEVAAHDTMYQARPTDSQSVKLGALSLRINNYINDWLPPILARQYFKVKWYLNRKFK